MLFIIEYVDTFTGIGGEALSWEFAKTEGEAIVKARAHLLLFKARFCAQGYRILSPEGRLVACGPGTLGQQKAMPMQSSTSSGEGGDRNEEAAAARFGDLTQPGGGFAMPGRPHSPSETKPDAELDRDLAGKRVLVVEDDGLIALDIVSDLQRAGCKAVGPAARLEAAMTMAAGQPLDAAVLDIFLDGAYAWQLAGALKAQGVPFLFQTGFGRFIDFPEEFASVPCLEKPVRASDLKRELRAILEHA